ncbi:major facilitator superfamily domain-containing protein [Aspergillus unguis]
MTLEKPQTPTSNTVTDSEDESTCETPTGSSKDLSKDSSDAPDGGLRAWLVVFGAWCGMMPSMGLMTSMGVLQTWLSENQLKSYSNTDIGWIFGVFTFFIYFGSVQIGPVFDAHGLKYILVPGCVGLVLSLMMLSVAYEYYQFMLGFGVLGGISASVLATCSIASIAHWFNKRHGLAMAIIATASGFGGIIFPMIFSNLITTVGWGWAIRIIAFIVALFCALCALCMRTRLPPQKGTALVDFTVFKELRYTVLSAAIVLSDSAFLIPITYILPYALGQGMSASLAYQLASILNGASILGRFLCGFVADYIGRMNMLLANTFFCSFFTLALWLPAGSGGESRETARIVAYVALFGFWSGSTISLPPVCIAQLCKAEEYGTRFGTTYSVVSVGTLVAIPVAGAIVSASGGGYEGVIWSCGMVYGLSFLLFLTARGLSVGWRLKSVF